MYILSLITRIMPPYRIKYYLDDDDDTGKCVFIRRDMNWDSPSIKKYMHSVCIIKSNKKYNEIDYIITTYYISG